MSTSAHSFSNPAAFLVSEPRSMLFVPGDDRDKLAKIPSLIADIIVVDLEDAVAPHRKVVARATVNESLANLDRSVLSHVAIRVNPEDANTFEEDLRLCGELGVRGVILPKLEDAEVVAAARRFMAMIGRRDTIFFAGIESLEGVRSCFSLVTTGVSGAYFGAEDFVAELGGQRTDEGLEVLYARSQVVLAAKLAGVAAIDQAVIAVHDLARFRADASLGRALGYTGKICLHPAQAHVSNEVFSPNPDEVARAQRIIATSETGVQLVDGEMVDGVHQRAASRLLARNRQLTQDRDSPGCP